MNQMQPDIYKVAPMAPASDSVPVIMPVGHQINIQCYNKTFVCLLETGDTRFPASTNSSHTSLHVLLLYYSRPALSG